MALLKDDSLMIFGTNVNVQPFNLYEQAVTKLWHAGAVLACGGHGGGCRGGAGVMLPSKNTDFGSFDSWYLLVIFFVHPLDHSDWFDCSDSSTSVVGIARDLPLASSTV